MPRIEVEIAGDPTSLENAFRSTAAGAQVWSKEMTDAQIRVALAQDKLSAANLRYGETSAQAGRATLALRAAQVETAATMDLSATATKTASSAFSHLSTLLIGGAGVAYGLEAVVHAAEQHQVVVGQQKNALDKLGLSYAQNANQIDHIVKAQGDLGFAEAQTTQALTLSLRATGNVTDAYRLLGVASNIARGTGRDLSAVMFATVKAFDGQTGALRRLVPGLTAGASGWKLIDEAGQKYAGAAVAYSTTAAGAQARLTVAIHETEVMVGTALLPTITTLASRLADWAGDSQHQEQIQRDINQAVTVGTQVVHGLEGAVQALTPVVRAVDDVTGGFAHTLEILAALKLASVFSGWAGGITRLGSSATVAEGQVAGLTGRLQTLQALGAAGIAISLIVREQQQASNIKSLGATVVAGDSLMGHHVGDGAFAGPGGVTGSLQKINGQTYFVPAGSKASDFHVTGNAARNTIAGDVGRGADVGNTGTVGGGQAGLSRAQQLALGLAADPNNVALLRQKQAADQAGIDWLNKRRAEGKVTNDAYIKAITALYNDRASVEAQITAITTAASSKADKAAKAKKKADDKAHQFSLPIALQVEAARAATTAITTDDVKAAQAIKDFTLAEIKSRHLVGQALIDAYNTIAAENSIIGTGPKSPGGKAASVSQVLAGVRFGSLGDKKNAEERVAQALAHGGRVPTGYGLQGIPVGANGQPVYNVTVLASDPYELSAKLEALGRHTAGQNSGMNAGRYRGHN